MYSSKSATDEFKVDMFGSRPKPTSFLELLDLLIKYHNQVIDWDQRVLRYKSSANSGEEIPSDQTSTKNNEKKEREELIMVPLHPE